MSDKKLWLWKNGDHFWAFDNEFPCYPDGDPMTLGEPVGYAILKESTEAMEIDKWRQEGAPPWPWNSSNSAEAER
jgi:hypothetical protein